jgi:hypothetical protein
MCVKSKTTGKTYSNVTNAEKKYASLLNNELVCTGNKKSLNSNNKMTFYLALTNGHHYYLPSKIAFGYGSYESDGNYYLKGSAERL